MSKKIEILEKQAHNMKWAFVSAQAQNRPVTILDLMKAIHPEIKSTSDDAARLDEICKYHDGSIVRFFEAKK